MALKLKLKGSKTLQPAPCASQQNKTALHWHCSGLISPNKVSSCVSCYFVTYFLHNSFGQFLNELSSVLPQIMRLILPLLLDTHIHTHAHTCIHKLFSSMNINSYSKLLIPQSHILIIKICSTQFKACRHLSTLVRIKQFYPAFSLFVVIFRSVYLLNPI